MSKIIPNRVYLTEDELPKQYYNIAADMPNKKIKKNSDRLKQTKDYYPIVNPDKIEDETNISIPSKQDRKRAKNWVDSTEK